MAELDCSLSCDRTESELSKPTSPKVSRSPAETAASAEDTTRKSKYGREESEWELPPLPSLRPPARPVLDSEKHGGLLPGTWTQFPAHSLSRWYSLSEPHTLGRTIIAPTLKS